MLKPYYHEFGCAAGRFHMPPGKQKPSVLFISGTHGNETGAIRTSYWLKNAVAGNLLTNQDEFSHIGFLIGWNENGIRYNTREFVQPPDTLPDDLNRCFSHEIKSDYTDKENAVNTVKSLISQYGIIVDIHNSPNIMDMILIDNSMVAPDYVAWCQRHNLTYVVRECHSSTIKKYAIEHGKLGITVELNGMGLVNGITGKQSEDFMTEVFDALPHLYLNQQNLKAAFPMQSLATEIKTHADGIITYVRDIPLGQYAKDEPIATIRPYDSIPYDDGMLETICAPVDGKLVELEQSFVTFSGKDFGLFQPNIKL